MHLVHHKFNQEAEANYRKVLALYPANIDMQVGIGFCQLGRGNVKGALATFRAAEAYAPADPRVRDGIAKAQARIGR